MEGKTNTMREASVDSILSAGSRTPTPSPVAAAKKIPWCAIYVDVGIVAVAALLLPALAGLAAALLAPAPVVVVLALLLALPAVAVVLLPHRQPLSLPWCGGTTSCARGGVLMARSTR